MDKLPDSVRLNPRLEGYYLGSFFEKVGVLAAEGLQPEPPTNKSGIYIVEETGKIMYVGRSVNVRNRIQSYADPLKKDMSPFHRWMFSKIHSDFPENIWVIVDWCSPKELPSREMEWIRELDPPLNVKRR